MGQAIERDGTDVLSGALCLPIPGPTVSEHERVLVDDARPQRGLRAFVTGPENELLFAPLAELFRAPAAGFSTPAAASLESSHDLPWLFLQGPPGAGKTHLARGIVERWRATWPESPSLYLRGADFARGYADAIERRSVTEWRDVCRTVDLFVLDDLGALAAKTPAQTELRHTLDALAERGARIVVTCALAPHQMAGLSPGLRSRLQACLLLPLAAPGPEARRVLLVQLARQRGLEFDDDAIDWLSERLSGAAPELAGALATLRSELDAEAGRVRAASGAPKGVSSGVHCLDRATVERHLHTLAQPATVTLRAIAVATAREFGVRLGDLRSDSRRKTIVSARGVAACLARELTPHSLARIGDYFGGRDHTTILHAVGRTTAELQSNALLRAAVRRLKQTLSKE